MHGKEIVVTGPGPCVLLTLHHLMTLDRLVMGDGH